MNKEKNIKELLQKFEQEDLSLQEAKQLADLMHEGDSNTWLKAVLTRFWQESYYDHPQTPTEKIWGRIKQDLPAVSGQEDVAHPILYRKLITFMKYAAVLILAAGLTWLAGEYFTDGIPGSLTSKNMDEYNEITVPYGSKTKISLPDGSIVNLNSGTILRYPAKFSRFSRNVYLDGEAFFDVKKDPEHIFYLKTNDITIKVLGTIFNVKSYSDEKTLQTTLISGSIEIYSNEKEISEKNKLLVLQPNQQVTIEKMSVGVEIVKEAVQKEEVVKSPVKLIAVNKKVDVSPVISWKDSRLIFRDESFAGLSRKLERWYNVEIEIIDPELKDALFSGIFVKETVEQALYALKLTTPFRYKMDKNQITIWKYNKN